MIGKAVYIVLSVLVAGGTFWIIYKGLICKK